MDPGVRGDDDLPVPSFGARLRTLREAAELSQDELAQRARVSTDAVGALERGTRTHPYPATVRALADALALTDVARAELAAAVPRRARPGAHSRRRGAERAGALPAAVTRLLGREDDVAAVCGLFEDPADRLVTLTGTGGIGKTRLAAAVAERVGLTRRHGAVFVALAPVLDEALVTAEIGHALGVPVGAGVEDEVLATLMAQDLVLVLDNFEHLLGAADVVAELLGRCPRLSVLVTSRAPLRVRGETEYPVRPLGVPDAGSTDSLTLARSPAAMLLMERGRAVRRDFVVRPDDVPPLAAICRRLAGLPLALELAATGLRHLDPATLLTRLDEVLASPGPVDLPARQHTLRATLDWSYGLLTAQDRRVLRGVSLFSGGFTVEAAEAVIDGPGVLRSIERLVEHSLITCGQAPDGRMRFWMLEPVAQYARSLLTGREGELAGRAHAEFFTALAERAAPEYRSAGQVEWLRRVDVEDGNLSAAVEWTIRAPAPELAARLVWALWIYWWVRGRWLVGRHLVEQVLELDLSDSARARTLLAAGSLAEPGVDVDVVEHRLGWALQLAQGSGDEEAEACASIDMGLAAMQRGRFALAQERFHAGLAAAGRVGRAGEWYTALGLVFLGAARRFQDDPAGAADHIEAGLGEARSRGDLLSVCVALYNLGMTRLAQGRGQVAHHHLVEAAVLCLETLDGPDLCFILDGLAAAESATGRPERVATLFGAAEAMRELVGSAVYGYYGPDVELRARTAERVRSVLGDAAYGRAFDAGRSLSLEGAVELARRGDPPGS